MHCPVWKPKRINLAHEASPTMDALINHIRSQEEKLILPLISSYHRVYYRKVEILQLSLKIMREITRNKW